MLPPSLHPPQPFLKAEPLEEAARGLWLALGGEAEVCIPVLATDLHFTLPDKALQLCLMCSLYIVEYHLPKEQKSELINNAPPCPLSTHTNTHGLFFNIYYQASRWSLLPCKWLWFSLQACILIQDLHTVLQKESGEVH